MFWLIVIGILVLSLIVGGSAWYSIDKVGSSKLPGFVKFLIIGAIIVALFALRSIF